MPTSNPETIEPTAPGHVASTERLGAPADKPIMERDTPVRRLEVAAMLCYRDVHPDGPLWQDLHSNTRAMWLRHVESNAPNDRIQPPAVAGRLE